MPNDTTRDPSKTDALPRLDRVDLSQEPSKDARTTAICLAVRFTLIVPTPRAVVTRELGPWQAEGAYELARMLAEEAEASRATSEHELVSVFPSLRDEQGQTIEQPMALPCIVPLELASRLAHSLAMEAARAMARQPSTGQSVWLEQGRAVAAAVHSHEGGAADDEA